MQEEILQNTEMMELILPILRADFTICETYTYTQRPPFTCPITAIGGRLDQEVQRQHLIAWQEQTSGPFHFQDFAGNHFFLQTEQDALFSFLTSELKPYLPSSHTH
ncbi:hypothetical protein KDK_68850 [Dictyobacter kobayashii]|uniref:Thioesterase domain-containing protein n=1 Tax=Dictyobacter kobayashii TaxID=2014872 RepID=A0A402AVI3_9CHLR|nr:hypothetical protein KDK_68850 [Dictyobacter kobayashii]